MGKQKFEDFCDNSIKEQEIEQIKEEGFLDEEDDEARAFNAGWEAQALGIFEDEDEDDGEGF